MRKKIAAEKECQHPEALAYNKERDDGSGKWDRVCGVPGCGFVMYETNKAGEGEKVCSHPPFMRNWRSVDAGIEVLMCDCGVELDRRGEPETESDVRVAEESFTNQVHQFQVEPEEISQDAPADNDHVTSPFSFEDNRVPGPDDICGYVVATGEGENRREVFVPTEHPTSYITREPHKISPRFKESMPVCVDDEELARLGSEMAEQFDTWSKTKVDAKKFAKACKEVTDRCEARMVELKEIIQDQARMEPVECQWEYDFTAGEKFLRRCDTWEIVKTETLTAEERQFSFDLDGSSEQAVEKLREMQKELAGGEEESDDAPFQAQAEIDLDQETINLRDEFCHDWRNCAEVDICMGPENTTGQCYRIAQDQAVGDPVGDALAVED